MMREMYRRQASLITGVRADVEDAISHMHPTDLGDVIGAKSRHVLSRAEQASTLSSTRGRLEPPQPQLQSRPDPTPARQNRIEQTASTAHDVRLHVTLWRTPQVIPDDFTCVPIGMPHAKHFLCNEQAMQS